MFPPHFLMVSAKGQVVIPAELRRKIGLERGQKVAVYLDLDGERLVVQPMPESVADALCGCLKGAPSLTAELVREHQEEIAREEAEGARRLRRARVLP